MSDISSESDTKEAVSVSDNVDLSAIERGSNAGPGCEPEEYTTDDVSSESNIVRWLGCDTVTDTRARMKILNLSIILRLRASGSAAAAAVTSVLAFVETVRSKIKFTILPDRFLVSISKSSCSGEAESFLWKMACTVNCDKISSGLSDGLGGNDAQLVNNTRKSFGVIMMLGSQTISSGSIISSSILVRGVKIEKKNDLRENTSQGQIL